jgi:hypothetical protein
MFVGSEGAGRSAGRRRPESEHTGCSIVIEIGNVVKVDNGGLR